MSSSASAEVYKLKTVEFIGRKVSIVLQNKNGPCPLLVRGSKRDRVSALEGLSSAASCVCRPLQTSCCFVTKSTCPWKLQTCHRYFAPAGILQTILREHS